MLMVTIALATASAAPGLEAEQLGLRLARKGTVAMLLPMMVRKDTEELVKSQAGLTARQSELLRQTAQSLADTRIAGVLAAEGHAFAKSLSLAELRSLVRFYESPVAARYRVALPQVMQATMQSLAGADFKKEVLAAYCAKAESACRVH